VDQFDSATPAGSGIRITDFEGSLLLCKPLEVRRDIPTRNGPSDVVVIEVAVLDGRNAGEKHGSISVFQKVLRGQLEPKIGTGRYVLGRLGRGEKVPGKTEAWVLHEPNEADKNKARTHLEAVKAAEDKPPF
jgi:hypothetical protein